MFGDCLELWVGKFGDDVAEVGAGEALHQHIGEAVDAAVGEDLGEWHAEVAQLRHQAGAFGQALSSIWLAEARYDRRLLRRRDIEDVVRGAGGEAPSALRRPTEALVDGTGREDGEIGLGHFHSRPSG